jgi:hypothetical protein
MIPSASETESETIPAPPSDPTHTVELAILSKSPVLTGNETKIGLGLICDQALNFVSQMKTVGPEFAREFHAANHRGPIEECSAFCGERLADEPAINQIVEHYFKFIRAAIMTGRIGAEVDSEEGLVAAIASDEN